MVEGLLGPRLRGRAGLLGQLSEMAQQVLRRAAKEALEWGQPRVGVEFVLLALLREVPELGEQLEIARVQAAQLGHDFIGPEHLLVAIATEGESFAAQFLEGARPDALQERLGAAPAQGAGGGAARPPDLPPNLSRFTRDLTALARNGDLDPVIGREREVERVIRIRGQGITLEVTPGAIDALVDRGFEPRFGARPLRRAIQREIETPISRMMLRGEVNEGDHVRVTFADGAFAFEPQRREAGTGPGSGKPQPERPEAGAGTADR